MKADSASRSAAARALPLTFRNIDPYSADGRPPEGSPDWIWEVDHPYLHGLFAPVDSEVISDNLVVESGVIPEDLYGMYVVNGPCQRFKPKTKYHYYDGDGMLHAIRFQDGKAHYNSKWVRTFEFNEEAKRGENLWPGICGPFNFDLPHSPIKDNSNTDVIFYAGKLMSLWYLAGQPYSIDPITLETHGPEDFGGKLKHNLSAHSQVDMRTGELLFFNYQDKEPYMSYGVANAQGELLLDVPIDIPGPRSPHDIGVTPNYSILHDLPYFPDVNTLKKHKKRVVTFHPDLPSRFGVIPRHGQSHEVRWFEAEPCYILHIVNCWEESDEVVMVGCRQPDPGGRRDPMEGPLASQLAERRRVHQLHEWRFNLRSGKTRERVLDDTNTEFPTTNHLYMGQKNRYAYHQYIPLIEEEGNISGRCQTFDALFKYDLTNGSYQRYNYGKGSCGSETHFAPHKGAGFDAAEDDGYLVTFVHSSHDWSSRCLIFDARDIEQGPITSIRMPRRFHVGFHAMWVRGEDIWSKS
ncbi:MAG: carotenoid oxygenase family protein [Parahaliea sp.]